MAYDVLRGSETFFFFGCEINQFLRVFLAAGVSMSSFVPGEEHGRAGAVPVQTRSGPDRSGPRSGGAAQNPRLPGPVSSGLPV